MPSKCAAGASLALVAGLAAFGCPPAQATAVSRNVLVLYSYSRLLPGNIAFETGLRRAVPASAELPVEIFDEFLALPRFEGPAYLQTMATYLREKYSARPPEVIVAAGAEALRFLLAHRDSLFPGVPVVHGAVERSDLDAMPARPADVIGFPVDYDFAGTIDQALRWHPKARRLVIVTGQAERDRSWEAQLRRAAGAFAARVAVEHFAALATPELLRRLAALESGAVVVTPGFFQDGAGRNTTPKESTEAIAAASAAPVYSVFPTTLGAGVVGGRMPSFDAIGLEAGRAVAEILAGASPVAVALPESAPSALNVDWRLARRFRIDARAIPADAIVHFREPTLFEAYRTQVLLAASALALQTGLIALLLVERRRRRAAENARQSLRRELAHAARLAVAGELLGSIAHEINQPLGAILANADAADLLLATGTDRPAELAEILSDIRRDDLRASEVIRRLRALLSRHEVERQNFDLLEAAREVESLLRSEARRRGVTLDLQTSAPGGVSFRGDRIQIQQILLNLVLNAMDAVVDAPEGRRTITISVAAGQNPADTVELSVRDHGQGIAPENLPKLFDSFFTTKGQGMGLGLSIARTLVEAHGGKIGAESVPGEGSVFRVELPIRQFEEIA